MLRTPGAIKDHVNFEEDKDPGQGWLKKQLLSNTFYYVTFNYTQYDLGKKKLSLKNTSHSNKNLKRKRLVLFSGMKKTMIVKLVKANVFTNLSYAYY